MSDAGGLVVRGGSGGTTARLDDLEAAAVVLIGAGRALATIAACVVGVARDPVLLASFLADPAGAAHVEAALLGATVGRSGVAAAAARGEALGVALGAAAAAYRGVEAGGTAAAHAVDQGLGRAVGGLVAVGVVATPTAVPLLAVAGGVVAAGGAVAAGPTAQGTRTATSPSASLPATAAQMLPDGVLETGNRFLEFLARHTTVVERGVDVAAGALAGAHDAREGAHRLASLGRVGPLLREDGDVALTVDAPRATRPPSGVADVLTRVATCSPGSVAADGRVTPTGMVRVEQVTHTDGTRAWIVEIPGTHRWSPVTGADPFDLTADVHALAGDHSAAGATVLGALRAAGARPDEPVLLAGHSLGGMVAAQLAADPLVRKEFRVTHVVTAGSPVALSHLPADVQVLSLEHTDDLVPRLDGAVNPDRPNWVTVSRPATELAGARAMGGDVHPRLVQTHGADTYAATGALVDASADPSVVAWRRGLGVFLDSPGATARAREVTGARR